MSDHWSLQMEYARQQANADQQYEEWVQNCESLRHHAVLFYRGEHQHEVAQELQERLAVLERNPPDPATATHVQVEDPGSGNGC